MDRKIEQAAVWSVIIKPSFIPAVKEILSEKDFMDPTCRHAFTTILRMKAEGRDIDLPGLYLNMGSNARISELMAAEDLVIFDPVHYALLLKQRNLEGEAQEAAKKREFTEAKEKITALENLSKPVSLFTISAMIEASDGRRESFESGYQDIDRIVKFQPEDMMLIAGRTSIGKSTLGLTILSTMAKKFPVGMVSFEMSPPGIAQRLTRFCTMDHMNEINSRMFVSCPSAFTLYECRKSIKDMTSTKGARVVLVDYLQLMQESKQYKSRHLEISFIIRQLKEMAKEFKIGLIVVCQLSRNIDTRGENSRPVLGDLKESGDIEHCADIALLLHREKNSDEAELIVAKNRYGQRGIINLIWVKNRTCYGSWDKRHDKEPPF